MFNLGYLPGGNKKITTTVLSTMKALEILLKEAQKHNMLIILVLYPGHPEGFIEANAVEEFANALDPGLFLVSTYRNSNQSLSPYLISITNKKRLFSD